MCDDIVVSSWNHCSYSLLMHSHGHSWTNPEVSRKGSPDLREQCLQHQSPFGNCHSAISPARTIAASLFPMPCSDTSSWLSFHRFFTLHHTLTTRYHPSMRLCPVFFILLDCTASTNECYFTRNRSYSSWDDQPAGIPGAMGELLLEWRDDCGIEGVVGGSVCRDTPVCSALFVPIVVGGYSSECTA